MPAGVPGRLALPLGNGLVIVDVRGAAFLVHALDAAKRAAARDGLPPPADFVTLQVIFSRAVDEARAGSAGGTPEVPALGDLATSAPRSIMVDPVGTAQAAAILQCSQRNARALLRRGAFETARRDGFGWLVERDEVVARRESRHALGHGLAEMGGQQDGNGEREAA